MGLKEVLVRLKGLRGRTFLLDHLKAVPVYNGGATHRRWGNRFVFYEADFQRLLDSLEKCPSKSLNE